MLDLTTMSALLDELGDSPVLSVYINADDHDPALRQAWRLRLAGELGRARDTVPASERAAFDAAQGCLEEELKPVKGFLPGPGWVAFCTPDGVRFSGVLPAPVPDRARWRRGLVLGPALRALKQERPVLLALVDSRRGRIFRYGAGELEEVEDLRADTFIDDLSDRTASKRAATHSGSRGETGSDAADRILERQGAQLRAAVAASLLQLAGEDAVVLIAGPAASRAALRGLLTALPDHRVDDDVALPVTASRAEARGVVERHASVLTARRQRRLVEEVLGEARAGARGAVGLKAVRRAVEQGQVDCLVVSGEYAMEAEEDLEPILARCMELGGAVEGVTGEAAELLAGEGVAARLRYAPVPA